MNSRQLWKSHQSHKLLRAKASRDILKFSLGNAISRSLQEVFSPADTMLFHQNTHTNTRLGTTLSKCPRRSTTSHG